MNAKLPPHLNNLASSRQQAEDEADESELPPLADGEYQAHARPSTKPLFAIHFLKPDGTGRTFEYLDLHSRCGDDHDFGNGCFKLAFLGLRPVIVTVEGRNLLRLYYYIHQHRMAWVMELPAERDFAMDQITLVTRIIIDPYEERGERS